MQNLRTMPPDVVRAEVRLLDPRAVPVRKRADQQRRAGNADGRRDGRDLRPRPARGAAEGPGDQRHPGQPLRPHLRRAQGPAGAGGRPLPRQRPPAADHRPHRRRRSAGGSTRPARWWTPAWPTAAASTRSSRRWRWTARRCRIRRFGSQAAAARGPDPPRRVPRRGDGLPRRRGAGAVQRPDLRRHRLGQDDAAQLPVALHPRRRARDHDRGRRRTAAPAAARRAPGDAPAQHRGQGRGHASATW